MKISEYSEVDPLEVLHLNLLCLDFALTPELVAMIRRMDPRPFPFFALYASVDGVVAGQVGVFRLPVVSTQGVEEVGGVWAVCTHPSFARRGIAARLLDEAHVRMRSAGLCFSTLGTNRCRVAHSLYQTLGYEDVFSRGSVVLGREALPSQTELSAERAGSEGLAIGDRLFERIAKNHLGFARRHVPFFPFLDQSGYLSSQDLWLLWKGDEPIGYAVAFATKPLLKIANLLLADAVDPLAAIAAIADEVELPYVQVKADQRIDIVQSLQSAFRVAEQDWGTFMVKSLVGSVTVDHFRRLYGVGTDRFLISYMDVT